MFFECVCVCVGGLYLGQNIIDGSHVRTGVLQDVHVPAEPVNCRMCLKMNELMEYCRLLHH